MRSGFLVEKVGNCCVFTVGEKVETFRINTYILDHVEGILKSFLVENAFKIIMNLIAIPKSFCV